MRAKHGTKVLGLTTMVVAMLTTMVFGVGGAQGQTLPGASSPGTFLVNLTTALVATLGGEGGLVSFLVPTRDLKLECHEVHVEEGKINSSTDALAKFSFLECLSLSLTTGEELPCEFTTLGGFIALFLILPILHSGEALLLFEHYGITTISYKSGAECPLPLNNPITGAIVGLPDALDAADQLILFSPTIQLLSGDVLRIGQQPSYLHADITLFLTGLHLGQKLGIH